MQQCRRKRTVKRCSIIAGRRAGLVASALTALVMLALGARPASAINVTTFGSTLNQAGATYDVTANLTGAGNCLTITASNITLNLHGFTLTGDGATGIGIFVTAGGALTNITINGPGVVRSFGHAGIVLSNTNRSLLQDVEVYSSGNDGVQLISGSTLNTVQHVNSHNNGRDGLLLQGGTSTDSNVILSCTFANNGDDGIEVASNSNRIGSNLCTGNTGGDGIEVNGGDSNFILGNRCLMNGSDGIELESGANNNRVWQNVCNSNSFRGIRLTDGTGNDVFGNTCNGSVNADGILLDTAADNNKIRSNQANNNFGNGIRVENGATGNTLTGNTALNNDAGINVYDNNPAPPPCANSWSGNTFGGAGNRGGTSATCIA
jgi:parallel beta-helix repeat protein